MNGFSIELTKRRSPKNLAKFSQGFKDWVSENNLEAGLLRKGENYKFFIDEVWPLSNFCNIILDESYEVEPIKGNQGYDAKVYRSGKFQFNIEIAYPHDGETRAQNARKLIDNAGPIVRFPAPSDLMDAINIIDKVCQEKAKKDYSDCLLLFNIAIGAVNERRFDDFLPAMQKVQEVVEGYRYKAKSVYLYFSPFKKVVKINA